ncbi:hypothetical protein HGRIS_010133 [Hohenbuehelia grisea]|uniref:Uncharacterized protein n=1 Tax=Hohenbuehelia grisea TaxID=104357 RepID=A0ABR3J3D5_9AGAR
MSSKTLVGSEASGSALEGSNHTPEDAQELLNERSREELTQLLMKADGLIKDRENGELNATISLQGSCSTSGLRAELNLTSAVCKTLYENNISLKSKHQALLARIPHSPSRSASASPVLGTSPLPTTPHYYDSSISSDVLPASSPFSSSPSPSPPSSQHSYSISPPILRMSHPHMRHTRKVSMTSADIAQLSDQNSELLQKLETLEAESALADQAGRRALRRLEREISVLRQDLERTQARSEELEEKAAQARRLQAARKRKKRVSQAQIAQSKRAESDQELDDTAPRDFAPPNELAGFRASARLPTSVSAVHDDSMESPSQSFMSQPPAESEGDSETEESSLCSASSLPERERELGTSTLSLPENALVAQLLAKIAELEDTNTRIIEQQADTARKLLDVQRETENMSLMYECLGEQGDDGDDGGVELQIVSAKEGSPGASAISPSTPAHGSVGRIIRFGSLKRRLENEMSKPTQTLVDEETIKSASSAGRIGLNHRPRKSVLGFFELEGSPVDSIPQSSSRRVLSPEPPSPSPPGARLSWAERRLDTIPPSPSLSSMSVGSQRSDAFFGEPEIISTPPPHSRARTLDSELGQGGVADFWGELNLGANGAQSHHFRTSSLYDLSLNSVPPSPSLSSTPASVSSLNAADLARSSDYMTLDDLSTSPAHHLSSSSRSSDTERGTTVPMSLPSDIVKHPQGSADPHAEEAFEFPATRGKHSLRYRRMTRTVRARTSQWADGRFKDTLAGLGTPPRKGRDPLDESPGSRPGTPKSVRRKRSTIETALDVVMEAFAGKAAGTISDPQVQSMENRSFEEKADGEVSPTVVASPIADYSRAVELHIDRDDGVNIQTGPDGKPQRDTRQQTGVSKLLLEVWLWLQFAVIILVFLWAMARRGPKSVLYEAEKRREAASR